MDLIRAETLPDLGYGLVILSRREKGAIAPEIEIGGEPKAMQRLRNALTLFRVKLCSLITSPDFSESDGVTPREGLIDELRYEDRKDLLFLNER